jgi:peptidoglycan/LPS O-acetylase OafA/YrhL
MAIIERTGRKPAKSTTMFRPDIQGLRALAVVAVIADHFLGWPSGGFVGVDVFFVISGFLITSLLLREHDRTGTISFRSFYLRRAKRIMPAAILVLVTTIAAGYVLFNNSRFNTILWDGIWAVLFGANWRFAVIGTDYFQAGGPVSPLQHYWSLAVEEQFYFVWPWLMLFIFWMVNRKGVSSAGHGRRIVGITIVVLTAASFAWSVWETQNNSSWAYFSTNSRAWELGVGAIVAVYSTSFSRLPHGLLQVLTWIGLTGIVLAIFFMNDQVSFPGPSAAFPVLAATLLILAGTGGRGSSLWPLTNPVSRYLGDISYSLYLWHFPVTILLVSVYPSDSVEYFVVGILTMLLLAILSFHFVENPARHFQLRKKSLYGSPRKISGHQGSLVGLGLLAAVTAVTVTVALLPREELPSAVALNPISASTGASAAPEREKCWGAAALDADADCDRTLGSDVAPNLGAFADDIGNADRCFPQKAQPMETCSYGSGTTRVALVGDSHAGHLLPGLSEQATALGWKLDTYIGVGCIWSTSSCPAMGDIQRNLLEGQYEIVLTSAYRGTGSKPKSEQAADFANQWMPVAATGSKIIVIEDAPNDVGPAIECVERITFDVTKNDCKIDLTTAFKVKDAAVMASADIENSAVVATDRYFCAADGCPAVIGNVIVYRDNISHMTATYSKTLGPYLAKDISIAAASLTSQ